MFRGLGLCIANNAGMFVGSSGVFERLEALGVLPRDWDVAGQESKVLGVVLLHQVVFVLLIDASD